MGKWADVKTLEIETPLSDTEAEATFVALVELLDRLGCCPVVTVAGKEDQGVSFSLHFSADRARKLVTNQRALDKPTEEMREIVRNTLRLRITSAAIMCQDGRGNVAADQLAEAVFAALQNGV